MWWEEVLGKWISLCLRSAEPSWGSQEQRSHVLSVPTKHELPHSFYFLFFYQVHFHPTLTSTAKSDVASSRFATVHISLCFLYLLSKLEVFVSLNSQACTAMKNFNEIITKNSLTQVCNHSTLHPPCKCNCWRSSFTHSLFHQIIHNHDTCCFRNKQAYATPAQRLLGQSNHS